MMTLPGRHRRHPASPDSRVLEQMVAEAVRRAAAYYADGQYGRGEYELVRLGLRLARRYGDRASAEVLADLRFIQEPRRPLPTGASS